MHLNDRGCTERKDMDNTNNINGYSSIYMAFGRFTIDDSKPQYAVDDKNDSGFINAISNVINKNSENDSADYDATNTVSEMKNKDIDPNNIFLSYTRIVTAKVPKEIASAMNGETIGSPFDLSGDTNELQITIKVSGGSRIYTASGTDKDGNSFTRDIDPYNVDPTDTDYAGFATLCEYIRDTEGMADNAMQAVKDAAPSDVTEKGNFLFKVSYTAENTGNLSGAKKLFEQMEGFFEKIMSLSGEAEDVIASGDNLINVKSDDWGKKTPSGSGGFKTDIFDELQEMIQYMFQKMLDDIIGINNSDEVAAVEESDDITTDTEKSEIAAGSVAETEEADTPDSEVIEESLGVENAVVA